MAVDSPALAVVLAEAFHVLEVLAASLTLVEDLVEECLFMAEALAEEFGGGFPRFGGGFGGFGGFGGGMPSYGGGFGGFNPVPPMMRQPSMMGMSGVGGHSRMGLGSIPPFAMQY